MAAQEKITVYNLADLKNTSDDAIPNYLNSLKFKQSHRLVDIRLAIGYTAFALAAGTFLWDWQLGFFKTKYLTAVAVTIYTILNGALQYWVWAVEHGTVYVGVTPDRKEEVRISTATQKNVPVYEVEVEIKRLDNGKKGAKLKFKKSFTEWFDGAGHLVVPPFQSMLASNIPSVGRADSKRVVSESSAAYTPDILDALADASVSVADSTPEPVKKAMRRRKV